MVTKARQWVVPHVIEFDPQTREAFLTIEDYLAELDAEIAAGGGGGGGTGDVPSTRNLTAGAGLTGGGDLSADRTFNVGAGTGIAVAADTVALDTTFTDARYTTPAQLAAVKLDDLSDVTTAGQTDKTALVYDGVSKQWVARTLSLANGDLTDVSISPAPNNEDALRWDSVLNKWTPQPIKQDDFAEVFTTDGDGSGQVYYGPPRTFDPPTADALWFCTRLTVDTGGTTPPAVSGKPVVTIT